MLCLVRGSLDVDFWMATLRGTWYKRKHRQTPAKIQRFKKASQGMAGAKLSSRHIDELEGGVHRASMHQRYDTIDTIDTIRKKTTAGCLSMLMK